MKKELKDLNLLDRFLFAEAIEDPDVLEPMLEIILGKEMSLKDFPQAEKELRKEYWGKRVRLDVLSFDDEGTVYNAEVQKENTGNLPRRSRVYQGMIDSKLLQTGERNYNKLNDLYIIMIAPFDLFGGGLFRYDFSMLCEESPDIRLNDGAKRIFLNTRGRHTEGASEELIDLLRYIETTDAATAERSKSDRIMQIHKKVNTIKESEEMGIKFMNAWEEKMMDIEAGEKKAQKEIARNLKNDGIPIAVIAKNTGLTEEEIEKL